MRRPSTAPRNGLCAALCLLAAGCSTLSPEGAAPQPDPLDPALREFATALAAEYDALAAAEANEGDWEDSAVFAAKASEARSSGSVPPEPFETRKVPDVWLGALEVARGQLLSSFDRGLRELNGPVAAQAQANFDCWLQEAEENFQPDDIATCKTGFEALVPELEKAATETLVVLLPNGGDGASAVIVRIAGEEVTLDDPFAAAVGSEAGTRTAELSAQSVDRLFGETLQAEPPLTARFMLTFETGGTVLTPSGERQFDLAIEEIRARENADVTVLGHTDRVGAASLNVRVARQRAAAIADALRTRQAEPRYLEVDSFGEADPVVATEDGVEEERNRRVEIVVR